MLDRAGKSESPPKDAAHLPVLCAASIVRRHGLTLQAPSGAVDREVLPQARIAAWGLGLSGFHNAWV